MPERKGKIKRMENNNSKIILHLCADIGSDSIYYLKNGYDVRCIGKNIGVENFHPPKNVYGIIANPVCTEFSVATGFEKQGNYAKGMILVNHCLRIIDECGRNHLKFWVIENPANGKLKDILGTPDYVYEPWWFGDPWTKKTALWGYFNHPRRKYFYWMDVPKNASLYIRPGRKKPSIAFLHKSAKNNIPNLAQFNVVDDMSFRSLCPQEFALEFFKMNR